MAAERFAHRCDDADLASAFMGINAVKGVEIGAGMGAAALTGEENADEMRAGPGGKRVSVSAPIVRRSGYSPSKAFWSDATRLAASSWPVSWSSCS